MRNPVPFQFLILGTKCPFYPLEACRVIFLFPRVLKLQDHRSLDIWWVSSIWKLLSSFISGKSSLIISWMVSSLWFSVLLLELLLCECWTTCTFPLTPYFFRSPLLFPHLFTLLSGRASHLYLPAVTSSSHLCTHTFKLPRILFCPPHECSFLQHCTHPVDAISFFHLSEVFRGNFHSSFFFLFFVTEVFQAS